MRLDRVHGFPIIITVTLFWLSGCQPAAEKHDIQTEWQNPFEIKLEQITSEHSGLYFNNAIYDKGNMNPFVWNFIYTGGGVATGDLDNDGLPDIYFAGNQVADKVYQNTGDFTFKDLSARAGISDELWTTGVTFADVNGDGLLDIYVCKTSPTLMPERNRNKLYINKGDFHFEEQGAKYGIDDTGYSIQATFFDIDQDGDLDMYLVNQPLDQFSQLLYQPQQVMQYRSGDKIFYFENGSFRDRTPKFLKNDPRYGLGVTLGDFNNDGWTDIYVCNDYHHGDLLLINYEGTFTDELKSRLGHSSFYSMGSDAGDINNDGFEDLVVLDMAFSDHFRSKTNMLSMNTDFFWQIVRDGQHYQYAVNTLQLNRGDGTFAEIGQMAGIAKTDWSWTALFSDLDLDGFSDIIVTNGILRDMKNNDFSQYVSQKYQGRIGPSNYLEAMEHLPSTPVANHIFKNNGKLKFKDISAQAGFTARGFSHGLGYADFDRDGKPDLVMNQMNEEAGLFRNASTSHGNFLQVTLNGPGGNTHGLGVRVVACWKGQRQAATMQTTRGYYSASEPVVTFGLGKSGTVDSLIIFWKHDEQTVLRDIPAGQRLEVDYQQSGKTGMHPIAANGLYFKASDSTLFRHRESIYNDFEKQVLLPHKLSQEGPFISMGDANGDGQEDFYIGGAAGQEGALFIQQADGTFTQMSQTIFTEDAAHEDGQSVFFDADQDGDLDLYVVSGSNEFEEGNPLLADRLYFNDGHGAFSKGTMNLPRNLRINGWSVETFDLGNDGDTDLFIGGRLVSGKYPLPPQSVILENRNGKFVDVTEQIAPWLKRIGMVTDAVSGDFNKDGTQDLVIVGEWMSPVFALQENGKLTQTEISGLPKGMFWSVECSDLDRDGDLDLLVGNLGQNNKFSSGEHVDFEVLAGDFDRNGDHDIILASKKEEGLLPVRGRECSSQEMPFILQKFPTYSDYGKAEITDILSADQMQEAYRNSINSFQHFILWNEGNLDLRPVPLPVACQTGIIRDFEVTDFDQDGRLDILFVGNHFPSEVETARYDGLLHGALLQKEAGAFQFFPFLALPISDYRSIRTIDTPDQVRRWLLSRNNASLLFGDFEIRGGGL